MRKGMLYLLSTLFLFVLAGSAAVSVGCQGWPPETAQPPIYVNIVIHNEETAHYQNEPQRFVDERAALKEFADMLDSHGMMLNWQSDWTFLRAVELYDQGGGGTGGLNIVQYLDSLGFEVDPHAHESQYNYADVAYMIELLGVVPSGVVGGFIAYPPQDCLLEHFWQPMTGINFPAYTWTPEILWGGATSGHVDEEDLWASGIWQPMDNEHFMTHDSNAPLPHVGKFGNTWDDLDLLIEQQTLDQLIWNHFHTATVFVRQAELVAPNFISDFEQNMLARDASGDLRWVGIAESVQVWQDEYNSYACQLPY